MTLPELIKKSKGELFSMLENEILGTYNELLIIQALYRKMRTTPNIDEQVSRSAKAVDTEYINGQLSKYGFMGGN